MWADFSLDYQRSSLLLQVVEIIQLEAAAKVNKALCFLKLGDPRGCIEAAREVVPHREYFMLRREVASSVLHFVQFVNVYRLL